MFGSGKGSFCRGGDLLLWCVILGAVGGLIIVLVSKLTH
jgi:hypothetical protein